MIRIFGILLISCAAALPGLIFSEKLIKRRKYLEELSALALNIGSRIVNGGDSISDIIKSESTGTFEFLKSINLKCFDSVEETVSIFKKHGLTDTDSRIAADFFNKLGTADALTEKQHCEYYRNRLEEMAEEAKRDLTEKGRLYRSLFMFLGAAVFIFLI